MKKESPKLIVPSVEEILTQTAASYHDIMNNIARMNSAVPNTLIENDTNTNMLLVIKRYINQLPETRLIFTSDDLIQIHKLVSISDNITCATFVRLTRLLRVRWEISMINPNHCLHVTSDGTQVIDHVTGFSESCSLDTMLLQMLQYVVNRYGEVDCRRNIEYIPPYTINNILSAIKSNRNISSYIFEKFNKIWNISYSYTIISTEIPTVQKTITMDPSGWM